jgi:hypothetical protein
LNVEPKRNTIYFIKLRSGPNKKQLIYGFTQSIYLPQNTKGSQLSELIIELFASGSLFKITQSSSDKSKFILTLHGADFKTRKTGGPEA